MYKDKFDKIETEIAVSFVKQTFINILGKQLNLLKVSSPLFIDKKKGLNDYLNNEGEPIVFKYQEDECEIIQSLAKWKRQEIKNLNLPIGQGIWTKMKAIRINEKNLSPYHSPYVEQFDWEKKISKGERTLDYLKKIVNIIYNAIKKTIVETHKKYSFLTNSIPEKIIFITSEELYKMYPELSSKEREDKLAKKVKAFFLIGIGHRLSHNKPHDNRASDYDD